MEYPLVLNQTGTFEQGNKDHMIAYETAYTSPVTYGPEQIKGHIYKITLTDTNWNGIVVMQPSPQDKQDLQSL